MNQELAIVLKLKDEASKALQGFSNKLENLQPAFKKMAGIGAISFGAVSTAIGFATKEAVDAQSEQNRLIQILKTTHNVTEQQIKLLNDQAKALQKVGVVSDGNISIVQSQLATFDLTVDTLHQLTPAILDYVVAEKGASATTEDFKQMTNGLAQALNGNFSSLTRTGFVLDEATKALIANGTEAERTQALVKVLGSTYDGFNKKARNTAEGGMVVLKNSFNEMMGTLGEQFIPLINNITTSLIPLIEKLGSWIEKNPELARNILIATLAVTGLVTVVGILGMLLPPVIAGFGLLAGAIGLITLPVLLVVAGIIALIAVGVLLYQNWDIIKEKVTQAISYIYEKLIEFIGWITGGWTMAWEALKEFTVTILSFLLGSILVLLETFIPNWKMYLTVIWDTIVLVFTSIKDVVVAIWQTTWNIIKNIWNGVVEWLSNSMLLAVQSITAVWTPVGEFFVGLWEGIKNTFAVAIDWIMKKLQPLLNALDRLDIGGKAKSVWGNVKDGIGDIVSKGKSAMGINDGIVQNGKVITTHPDDYLIATKNPSKLGGGGVTININTMVGDDTYAEELGNKILNTLRLQSQL